MKMYELQLYTTTCVNLTNSPLNKVSQRRKHSYLYDSIYTKFQTPGHYSVTWAAPFDDKALLEARKSFP